MKHKVSINIVKPGSTPTQVVRSSKVRIRKKLLDFLFGQNMTVLVLSTGGYGADCRNQRSKGRR
ncbi:hypothetical protein [Mogibacterium diversum]|uniref:hypothetical protein n=1 Tax=Mogibacterium diversum TaxID=114527 RepID=UPI0028E8C16D|nr:hypothetical protein [Mogibacterium diversum]